MSTLLKHVLRIVVLLLAGGLLGATLVRIAPGFGVDEEMLDSRLNQSSQEAMRGAGEAQSGLGSYYLDFCRRMLRGDLGTSTALNEPVRNLIAERAPDTARTMACGLVLAWILGLAFAFLSVVPVTRAMGGAALLVSGVLLCVPAAVLAMSFVVLRAPGRLAVGVIVFPKVFQIARSLLERSAALPHILTARAKGLGELRILLWHVIPLAAPQILSLLGVSVCMALAACIPVEVLCDLPGIGQLAWKAALSRDLPLLVTLTMIVTAVTLLANTTSDLIELAVRKGEA